MGELASEARLRGLLAAKLQLFSAPQGPEGQGGCFDSPSLGPLDSLPTHNDQGMSPWTQKRKVALGVWLKKLFTARQRNLRIAFSGRQPPAAPILSQCVRQADAASSYRSRGAAGSLGALPPAHRGSPPIRPCGPPSPVGGRAGANPLGNLCLTINFAGMDTGTLGVPRSFCFVCHAQQNGEVCVKVDKTCLFGVQ